MPDADFHIRRLASLEAARAPFESQWEQIAERILPTSSGLFSGRGAPQQFEGARREIPIFDTTASIALSRFSSVMESLITPQASRWHRLVPSDKSLMSNRVARQYLDELTEVLFDYRYRASANFVSNIQQVYQSLGAFGNGILFVDADDESPGLRYHFVHLAEAYFQQNFAGVVDTLYRRFFMSPRQIAQRFEGAPKEIVELASAPDEHLRKRPILHVVMPRGDYDPGRVDPKGRKFLSLYIDIQTRTILEEGGYDTFPFAVARYTQAPGETYGRGPAQLVLPAIKLINEQKKVLIRQAHKALDPVLLVHDNGMLSSLSLRPGAINPGGVSAEGRELVKALPVGRVDVGEAAMQLERAAINDAFLLTLFQILTETPQMTATEVLERVREKGMLVAPTAARQQSGLLEPLIERELELLFDQRLAPEPPPILAGANIKIEYDAPLSRMQRAERAAGFLRSLSFVMNYVQATGDPSPLDHFDFDAATPEIMDIFGSPAAWVRSPAQVEAVRRARAQAVASAQAVSAAPAIASLAKAGLGQAQTNTANSAQQEPTL
jgi:hypothetical protein